MRALKLVVVVMGAMLVVGFVALIVVIAGRIGNKPRTTAPIVAPPFAAPPVELPPGARVEAITAGSERLVLNLLLPSGQRQLVIIDLATGRKLGTVPLTSE